METNNETDQDVDYEQTGSSGAGIAPCTGTLPPGGSASFSPCGDPPWRVRFTAPGNSATSPPSNDASDRVTLRSDWTVTVS